MLIKVPLTSPVVRGVCSQVPANTPTLASPHLDLTWVTLTWVTLTRVTLPVFG